MIARRSSLGFLGAMMPRSRDLWFGVGGALLISSAAAQTPVEHRFLGQWDQSYGGEAFESAFTVAPAPDGGFLLGGYSNSSVGPSRTAPNLGGFDFWVVRTDERGVRLWDQSYGGSDTDVLRRIVTTSDGGWVLGGTSSSAADGNKSEPRVGGSDFWLIKIDSLGRKEWERVLGGSGDDTLSDLLPIPGGGYYAIGISRSEPDGSKTAPRRGDDDLWCVRIDANGAPLWDRSFGNVGRQEPPVGIATADGGLFVGTASWFEPGGNKTVTGYGNRDFWFVRLTSEGNLVSEWTYGGRDEDVPHCVAALPDGGFLIGGSSRSGADGSKRSPARGQGDDDGWLIRVDGAGATLWDRTVGGTGSDSIRALVGLPQGRWVTVGVSDSAIAENAGRPIGEHGSDLHLVGWSSEGDLLTESVYGGRQSEAAWSALRVGSSLFVAGSSDSPSDARKQAPLWGQSDHWLMAMAWWEAPVGTPVVRVNGRFEPSRSHAVTNHAEVTLVSSLDNPRLFYTLDGSAPSLESVAYRGAFHVARSVTVRAVAYPADSNTPVFAEAVSIGVVGDAPSVVSAHALGDGRVGLRFSVPMDPGSAGRTASYRWLNGPAIVRAMLREDPRYVQLESAGPVMDGAELALEGLTDSAGRPMANGTTIRVPNSGLLSFDIGEPAHAGSVFSSAVGEYDIEAGGTGIEGARDVFTFVAGLHEGDFDLRLEVTNLLREGAAPQTGLMLRDSTDPGSRQVAVLIEWASLGARLRLLTRERSGGDTVSWPAAGDPVVLDHARSWLRLRRQGNELTAFRSADGLSWLELARHRPYPPLPGIVWLGMATAADTASSGATRAFVRHFAAHRPPRIAWLAPSENASFAFGTEVSMETIAEPGDTEVAQVEFFDSDQSLGKVEAPPYRLVWNSPGAGNHVLMAVATDAAGRRSEVAGRNINVLTGQQQPPQVRLVAPSANARFTEGEPIRIVATSSDVDGTVVRLEFYDGDRLLDQIPGGTSDWTWSRAPVGTRILIARAIDNEGLATVSAPLRFTVVESNRPPILRVQAPLEESVHIAPGAIEVSIEAVDHDGAVAEVVMQVPGQAPVRWTSPPYTFSWPTPPSGDHVLSVVATDDRGARSGTELRLAVVSKGQAGQGDGLPATPTALGNVWATDDEVSALLVHRGVLYAGGRFTRAGLSVPGTTAVTLGAAGPTLIDPVVDGVVDAALADPGGAYVLGGLFTQVAGRARTNLVRIREDRTVDEGFSVAVDRRVSALARWGDTLFLGGSFQRLGEQSRAHLAAVDSRSGAVLPWAAFPDGAVTALAVRDSVLYVGGDFRGVGGVPRSRLAAVTTSRGDLLSWAPGVDGTVLEMVMGDGRLYVRGTFGVVAGTSRSGVAALDPVTGAVLAFAPRVGGSLARIVWTDKRLFVGGVFGEINGQVRDRLAELDPLTGEPTSWAPGIPVTGEITGLTWHSDRLLACGRLMDPRTGGRVSFLELHPETAQTAVLPFPATGRMEHLLGAGTRVLGIGRVGLVAERHSGVVSLALGTGAARGGDLQVQGEVHALAGHEDHLYVGGSFGRIGGHARSSLAAIDVNTARPVPWTPSIGPVLALGVAGGRLVVGGEFQQADGQPRRNLAAYDLRGGHLLDWNPGANGVVRRVVTDGDRVYVAGDFTRLGDRSRAGLGCLDAVTGSVHDWDPSPEGVVRAILPSDSRVYLGGFFTRVGGAPRRSLGAVDRDVGRAIPWVNAVDGSVLALAMFEGALVVGGQFQECNGVPRANLAALPPWRATEAPLPFTASVGDDGAARILALATDGTALWLAGSFGTLDGQARPNLAALAGGRVLTPVAASPTTVGLRSRGPWFRSFVTEFSDDLVSWTAMRTNATPVAEAEDARPTVGQRFYRSRELP